MTPTGFFESKAGKTNFITVRIPSEAPKNGFGVEKVVMKQRRFTMYCDVGWTDACSAADKHMELIYEQRAMTT